MIQGHGKIGIKPQMAELKTDKNIVFKADPYCVLLLGNQKRVTKPCKSGGNKPMWDETVVFERSNEEILTIQLWDKDLVSKDDFIATGMLNICQLCKAGTKAVWIDLFSNGEPIGRLLVETEFAPFMKAPSCEEVYSHAINFIPTHY